MEGVHSLDDIINHFDCDDAETVNLLQQLHLIKENKRCRANSCRKSCALIRSKRYWLSHCFRCPRCRKEQTLTDKTFFERSKMSPKLVFYLLWMWACEVPSGVASNVNSIPRNTVYRLYLEFRAICTWTLTNNPDYLAIGGPDQVVQIEENVFTRQKGAVDGVPIRQQQWVVGLYSTIEKRGLIKLVENRDSDTLRQLILQYVRPGTEIWTVCREGYSGLNILDGVSPYIHKTVTHSQNFVDPLTGMCKNMVAGYLGKWNQYCRQLGVLSSSLLSGHLDQFMWMSLFGRTHEDRFCNMLAQISERYPV